MRKLLSLFVLWLQRSSRAFKVTAVSVIVLGVVGFQVQMDRINPIAIDGEFHTLRYGTNDVAIQTAINAAPDGGTVVIDAGTYTGCNALPITVTRRITVRGSGWGSNLQVCSGASGTTDVFLLKPATGSDVQGMRFSDFYISAQSGTPGRYGFNIDGTNASVAYLNIEHVRVDTLGNYALAVTNAGGLVNGSPYTTNIASSLFSGGINLQNAGDSLTIRGSTFPGPRDITINLVNGGSNGGAHGFDFADNNVTTVGGIVVQNCWQCQIGPGNDIESPNATSTEVNNALIDVQGAATKIQNLKIVGNYLGASNLEVADTVRVDRAIGTLILNNYSAQGTGVTYRLTANADRTYFAFNRQAPDNPISSFLADLGTSTAGEYFDQNGGSVEHYGLQAYQSSAGTVGLAINSTQFKLNGTNGALCSTSDNSTHSPVAASCDIYFARTNTSEWAIGSSVGATDAHLVQTGGIDLGTQQVRGALSITSAARILLSATAPTIATHFNTSGDSIATNGTASFTITVGTGAGTSTGVLTLPTAATGWNCWLTNQTRADQIQQSASSQTSATFTNFGTTFAATNWTNSDVLRGGCSAN